MRVVMIFTFLLNFCLTFAQETSEDKEKEALAASIEANNYVYEGNTELLSDDFVEAEVAYRKAIAKDDANVTAKYNLANAYYKEEKLAEAHRRYVQAAKTATNKQEKHSAFHNMGNIFMKTKEYEKAVEAYKNALRNDPNDDETRYNYALAKELLKKQQQQNQNQDQKKDQENKQDQNKDNKDKDKDNKEKEGDKEEDENKDDQKENDQEGDKEDDKEGDKKEDKNKNDQGDEEEKKDKEDENKGGEQPKDQQQQPQRLSPQQLKNLLEAMNNEEKKVQDKINAKKAKGVKVKAEKDW
ncbi:tetratricopeptide repeat protein [Sungkyunkwania multivorans]|uniref:Tetratricopeptide repeat protein n=1 Tax=Sungkyunkwania multivorans TaxID=1173618 RepID=A0ABW3CZN3_9FLAO